MGYMLDSLGILSGAKIERHKVMIPTHIHSYCQFKITKQSNNAGLFTVERSQSTQRGPIKKTKGLSLPAALKSVMLTTAPPCHQALIKNLNTPKWYCNCTSYAQSQLHMFSL